MHSSFISALIYHAVIVIIKLHVCQFVSFFLNFFLPEHLSSQQVGTLQLLLNTG